MLIYRAYRKITSVIRKRLDYFQTWIKLKGNDVKFSSFRTHGVPYISVNRGASMTIGKNFSMNNGIKGNPIGCYAPCTFYVNKGSSISIADNVGISQSALIAYDDIKVLNNVKIGGGSNIYY